jgi:predicted site-specific integrase-resolvase
MTTMATKRVYPRVDANTVRPLEFWVSLPEAGEMLGISRQRAYGWAAEGKFKTIRKISSGAEKRATFVVKRTEIEKLVKARAKQADTSE